METKTTTDYRKLKQTEMDLISEGNALAEQCGAFISKLRESDLSIDQAWVGHAEIDLQRGFMGITRAIARPTTF